MSDAVSRESHQRALIERAALAIKRLQAENEQLRTAHREPIAIVGMACRFPGGAHDLDAYWRLLAEGRDAIVEIPEERWPAHAVDLAELPALRWAGLIDAVDGFDAEFFGITPREAAQLDPQQRLLLEVSWEALEHALQPTDRLATQPVGVFVGIATSDYQHRVLAAPDALDGYSATGTMASVAAGRLAYTLGLQGPCAAVDTACSSSLVALHLACQSLRSGESALAIAGGVNLVLSPTWMRMVGLTQSLSPDGRCKTFDARANGFVRGEGCGVVVLKRLSDAQRDGDRVWAVVRGSSINHDGRSGGLTVPNVLSQQATLRKALDHAGVSPAEIGYVEAHGTGTPIGDPIELEALKAVLGAPRGDGSQCGVGSVKTNLGHLEAAAGIAGIIKVALALDRAHLPAQLHFRDLNPRVSLDGTSLAIAAEPRPWPAGARRCAVVSSFGISGTNAGAVLEEAPAAAPREASERTAPRELLLPLSARSPEALRALAGAYADRLGALDDGEGLAALVAAAGARRSHHAIRHGFVGATRDELVLGLRAFAQQPTLPVAAASAAPRIAMVFPGQGSQWLGMGRELDDREPVFRDALCAFDAAVRNVAGWSVRDALLGGAALDRVDLIQPAIVAIQLGLAALWRSWGVEPAVVIGQSMGEVSAACVAGALDLEDAARVITVRSRLVAQLRGGAMASVELPADELAASGSLGDGLGVAAVNGPSSTLVAGRADAIDRLVAAMTDRGVFCRKVKVDYASHSPEVEPLRAALLAELAPVRGRPPALAIRSTVHGDWIAGELDAGYWYRNLREPVQLYPVLSRLLDDGIDALLEVSPHPILGPVLQAAAAHHGRGARIVASLRRDQPERTTLLHTLAALYAAGQPIAFERLAGASARWIALPGYPWQRARHWLPQTSPAAPAAAPARDALPPGTRLRSPALRDAVYEVALDARSLRCFDSHRQGGGAIAPGGWMLSMIVAALRDLGVQGPFAVRDATFARPLVLTDGDARQIQLILGGAEAGTPTTARLVASPQDDGGAWPVVLEAAIAAGPARAHPPLDVAGACARMAAVPAAEIEALVGAPGATRWVEALYRGDREIVCRLRAPASGDHADRFVLHPEPIHEALVALVACAGVATGGYAPIALAALEVVAAAPAAWIRGGIVETERAGRRALSIDLQLYDRAHQPIAAITGLRCVPASLEASLVAETGLLARDRYELAWQPLAPVAGAATGADPAAPWLILGDARGTCELVARRLEAGGQACIRIARDADLQAELAALAGPPRGTLVGWGLDIEAADGAEFDVAALDALRGLRALAGRALGRLWIATRGAVAVDGIDDDAGALGAPAGAALWGLGRVLGREHPEAAPRLVDLDPRASADASAAELHRALTALDPREDQLALRGDQRFGLRLRRVRALDRDRAPAPPHGAVRADASYLITGGLGRLGLAVAEWLVACGARHLVLVSRSQPSEAARQRIAALAERGARVVVARADVADLAALRDAIAAAEAELPEIRGVIHAAGQARQALITGEPWSDYVDVLGAKAAGAWHLHALTRHRALDFFVMFSSVAGVLGVGGMGSYAAANAYLDALAEHRRARGLPALSIAWGVWDRGLDRGLGDQASRVGLVPFTTGAGLAALGALLGAGASGASRSIVARIDWARYVQDRGGDTPRWLADVVTAQAARGAELGGRTDDGPGAAPPVASLAALSGPDLADRLLAHVAGVVAETLGYPRHHALPRDRGLFELGFDSLLALDLRRRLSRDLGRPFPATLTFDHPTIAALAAFLAETLASEHRTGAVTAPAAPAAGELVPPVRAADGAGEPIAIIGIGCRFPGGAADPDAFWDLLRAGRDAISDAPDDRWDIAYFDPDATAPGKFHVRRAGFLDDVASFDPELFGISPREAERMDPQQRLLLEVTWEALEHAGISIDALVDSPTGVFVSAAPNQYFDRFAEDPRELDAYALTGNLPCTLSGRVSYVLGLRGPNLCLDTGCSGALVALHLACQSLRAGESDLAVAAGVNVLLSTDMMIGLGKTGTLSPDGRCKTFDGAADGFARGEGCGVVVVKRLRDAEASGDRVIAVIRGSAVNHDGRSSGLTVPSGPAQQALMVRALAAAGVRPADVELVEAHGTGTQLGDPIEVGALAAVYGKASGRGTPCWLGAVKTNLGHLEAAAGVAGVIKAALAVERGEIPPNVHFAAPSRELPIDREPFAFPTQLHAWPSPRRIAAVSSFGLGGTNAHAVLESPPAQAPGQGAGDPRAAHVLALSARGDAALVAQAARMAAFVEAHPEVRPADIAYSANRRTRLPHRAAIAFRSREELVSRLAAFADAGAPRGAVEPGGPPRIGFLFTGQGSQYASMGRDLAASQPVFRDAIARCAAVLDRGDQPPLADMLGDAAAIDRTERAQPALFAVQYALTCLWRSWGVEPHAVFGHSVGEIAAACAAGVLELDDALHLIRARADAMGALPPGAMVSARAPADDIARVIAPFAEVAIAALNGPAHTVISGPHDALLAVTAELRARGIETRPLRVSVAFHSPAVDPILAPFERAIAGIAARPARVPWITGLTGTALAEIDAAYWSRQAREPVQFAAAMRELAARGCDVLLEIGPHPTLTGLAAEAEPGVFTCVPSLRRGQAADDVIAHGVAQLWSRGAPIDWRAWDRPFARTRHPLPGYAFQRRRFWVDARTRRPAPERRAASWYARCEWREAPAAVPDRAAALGTWVLLADAGGVATALAAALGARGDRCTLIRHDERVWTADELERALDAAHPVRGVVHLWSLDAAPTAELDEAALDRAEALGVASVLALVQALARRAAAPLWLVTRGAMCTGDDAAQLAVAQAPAWGLGAVIATEHPELWGGAIDLSPDPGAAGDPAARAAEILTELTGGQGEDRVAWRGGRRLVARLARFAPARPADLRIRPDATYLVTGGHGALGAVVAGWLADRGARHLVLVSRRGDGPAIAALTARGVHVSTIAADIAAPGAARAVVQQIADRGPPLAGIVHTAGVVEDGLIVRQTWPACERVLRPKVHGAWALHREARDLDFVVYFSSAASLLGPHGQASYAAGNAFLDALAHHARAQGIPAVAINWGPWQLGMAARLDPATARRTLGAGWDPLSAADGAAALDRLVGGDGAQVAVLPVEWSALDGRARVAPLTRDLVSPAAAAPARAPTVRERLAAASPAERDRLIGDHVRGVVERTLGWAGDARLGVKQRFTEVGMDSLMAIEIRNRLQADLEISLAATTLFNYPTLAALTEVVRERLAPAAPSDGAGDASGGAPADPAAPPADRELSETDLIDLIARKYQSRT